MSVDVMLYNISQGHFGQFPSQIPSKAYQGTDSPMRAFLPESDKYY